MLASRSITVAKVPTPTFTGTRGVPRIGRLRKKGVCATAVDEWDLVEYESNVHGRSRKRLGRVTYVSEEHIEVDPLVEEAPGQWVCDDSTSSESITQKLVIKTIDYEYSQRMEQDRIKNPHGEHAEELWNLLEALGSDVYTGEQDD